MANEILKERDGRYVLDFYSTEGGRVRRIIGTPEGSTLKPTRKAPAMTLEQAQTAESEIVLYLNTGKRPSAAVMTLQEYVAKKYLNWHKAEFPFSHYRIEIALRLWILPFFGRMGMDQIEPDTVDRWVTWRTGKRPNVSRGTIEKEFRTLMAVLNKAVIDRKISGLDRNNAEGAKISRGSGVKKRKRGWYDAAQLQTIYAAEDDLIWRAIWRLFASTGMRKAEAMGLLKAKVDLAGQRLDVIATEVHHVKSQGSERPIDLNASAIEALTYLIEHVEGPYVLPRFHSSTYTHRFKRLVVRVGLPGSLHWLRHSFISHFFNYGDGQINPVVVQKLAGHANLSTTMIYTHVDRARTLAAVQSIKT